MERRTFLTLAASSALAKASSDLPKYRTVSRFQPAATPGMPGKYHGGVVGVRAAKSIDTTTGKIDRQAVREMMAQGMRGLTGAPDAREAWRSFFSPSDVVGIKVNCSGAPGVMSSPEVVAEIVRNLMDAGLPAKQIWIYERFPDQMDEVRYDRYVPSGVNVDGIEKSRGSISGYDPATYVEVDFFGEE